MDQTMKRISHEMDDLLENDYWHATNSESGRFDWDVILNFSIESVQTILMTKAPLVWMVLTLLAIRHRRSQLAGTRTHSKQGG